MAGSLKESVRRHKYEFIFIIFDYNINTSMFYKYHCSSDCCYSIYD